MTSMTNQVKVFTTKLGIMHTILPTHKTQDQLFNFPVLFYGAAGKGGSTPMKIWKAFEMLDLGEHWRISEPSSLVSGRTSQAQKHFDWLEFENQVGVTTFATVRTVHIPCVGKRFK